MKNWTEYLTDLFGRCNKKMTIQKGFTNAYLNKDFSKDKIQKRITFTNTLVSRVLDYGLVSGWWNEVYKIN